MSQIIVESPCLTLNSPSLCSIVKPLLSAFSSIHCRHSHTHDVIMELVLMGGAIIEAEQVSQREINNKTKDKSYVRHECCFNSAYIINVSKTIISFYE